MPVLLSHTWRSGTRSISFPESFSCFSSSTTSSEMGQKTEVGNSLSNVNTRLPPTVLIDHQHRHVRTHVTHTSPHLTICFYRSLDSATLIRSGLHRHMCRSCLRVQSRFARVCQRYRRRCRCCCCCGRSSCCRCEWNLRLSHLGLLQSHFVEALSAFLGVRSLVQFRIEGIRHWDRDGQPCLA